MHSTMNELPEVASNAHVVALLGISDPDPAARDGWFLADFCLLNRLLDGLGSTQLWMTCIDIAATVAHFGPILHGNPFRPRRVVYNRNQELSNLAIVAKSELKNAFLERLRSTSATAASRHEPLLLILIGHGEEEVHGILIGSLVDDDLETVLPRDVQTALGEISSPVSIILTSCYSGGWLSAKQSVMAAVAATKLSDSYQRSASGRFRGGLFTHAIANTLIKDECRQSNYRGFTENITANLRMLFALLAEENPPVYSAQGNSWSTPQEALTGLGYSRYRDRYNALPLVPANPIFGTSDRQHGSRRQPPTMPPSTWAKETESLFENLITAYHSMNPGRETAAKNTAVGFRIGLFKGEVQNREFTLDDAIWLAVALRTRISLGAAAESYTTALGLRPFPSFAEFDNCEWFRYNPYDDLFRDTLGLFRQFPKLFSPFPFGRPKSLQTFDKPKFYVAAAIRNKGIDVSEAYDRLLNLQNDLYPSTSAV
jgi:hypothetical protein